MEQAIYDLFSNQIHSLPISNDYLKVEGPYSGNEIIELALEIFKLYLSILVLNYARIRRLIKSVLDVDEKEFLVRTSKDISLIAKWIDRQMEYLDS